MISHHTPLVSAQDNQDNGISVDDAPDAQDILDTLVENGPGTEGQGVPSGMAAGPPRGPPQLSDEEKAAKKAEEEEYHRKRLANKGKNKKKNTKDWNKVTERDLEKDWEEGDDPDELEREYDHSQKIIEMKQRQMEEERTRKAKAKKLAAKKEKQKAEGGASAKKIKGKSKGKGNGKGTDDLVEGMPRFDPENPNPEALQAALRQQAARKASKKGKGGMSGLFNQMGGNHLSGVPGGLKASLDSSTGTSMYFVDLYSTQPGDNRNNNKKKGLPWDKQSVDDMAGYWSSMLKSAHLAANVYNLGAQNKDGQMLLSIDKGWQTTDILKFVLKQPAVKKLTKDNKDYTKDMLVLLGDDDDEL